MHLAIGDVVRDRSDMTLGTVVGLVTEVDGNRVAVYVPGSTVRLSDPYDLDVIARHAGPTATGRGLAVPVALILATFAALFGCLSARSAGAGWLPVLLSGLGGAAAVMTAYRCWARLTGPRRFRV